MIYLGWYAVIILSLKLIVGTVGEGKLTVERNTTYRVASLILNAPIVYFVWMAFQQYR